MQRPSKFQVPTRRAVASLALVSVLSAIEKQQLRKAQKAQESQQLAQQDMSGELQTIPARHGVATFVPRGRTIKIINTYGKQVVSTWAFGLHEPPSEGDAAEEVDNIEETAGELKEEWDNGEEKEKADEGKGKGKQVEENSEAANKGESSKGTADPGEDESKDEVEGGASKDSQDTSKDADGEDLKDSDDDPPEQAPDTPQNKKSESTNQAAGKKPEKRTWSSYLPSIPYRSKKEAKQTQTAAKEDDKSEQEKNEATSKAWSSYLPTGKGFSSYVPNVQLPDSQEVMSSFKSSHHRDPNKSYAEQLYDFSKTPVGAGGLAVATGSGTASSIYAAYSAYTKLNPAKDDLPPMEYLSLPHTRASSHRLVPEVNDTLLTNLRNPIMTLIEDTSTGAHDTLTAACDASLYAALDVDKPAEHGSCAENLVLALKELNEKAGLKGTKAVGADITVNIAPTPLHLFMNAPIELDASAQAAGAGAKGAALKVEEPQAKKRSFVRFRAERDIVVVLSSCPMDVGKQNGGKCMAANFMVEDVEGEGEASAPPAKKKAPPKLKRGTSEAKKDIAPKKDDSKTAMPKPKGGPQKAAAVKKSAEQANSGADDPPESELPEKQAETPKKKETETKKKVEPKKDAQPQKKDPHAADKTEAPAEEALPAKKKPKKLERRGGAATPKGESK